MSKQVDQSPSYDKPDRDAGSSQNRKLDDFSEVAEEAENDKKSAKIQAEEEKGKKGADYHNKFYDVKALVKAKHLKKEHFDPEPEKVKKMSKNQSADKSDGDSGSSQTSNSVDLSGAAEAAENTKRSAKFQVKQEKKEKKADYKDKYYNVKDKLLAKESQPEKIKKALAEVDAEVKSSMAMDPEPNRTDEGEPSDALAGP